MDAYTAYTKYLLLEANDFQLNSEPLKCTDLDSDKEAILVFENSTDGIRLCDMCPNLPPFDKMLGVIINQEDNQPRSTKYNLNFEQCFMHCVDDKHCIGYSYSEAKKICLTFNQMRADNERLQFINQTEGWTTVLIKQPMGGDSKLDLYKKYPDIRQWKTTKSRFISRMFTIVSNDKKLFINDISFSFKWMSIV